MSLGCNAVTSGVYDDENLSYDDISMDYDGILKPNPALGATMPYNNAMLKLEDVSIDNDEDMARVDDANNDENLSQVPVNVDTSNMPEKESIIGDVNIGVNKNPYEDNEQCPI